MSLGRVEAKHPIPGQSLSSIQQTAQGDIALDAAIRAQIGQRMRHLFDGVADPLPEQFQDMLKQLEARLQAAK